MLRIALKRKLASDYRNALLRIALKRKTRDALLKCYASHRIKEEEDEEEEKKGKLATRHINAMLRTALNI
jgi:hypothetical protein